MRDLLLSELQQVNGGNVLTDLQSIGTQGLSHREINFMVLSLGTGAVIGGLIHWPWGVAVGLSALAGWTVFDLFALSKETAPIITLAPAVTTTTPSTPAPATGSR